MTETRTETEVRQAKPITMLQLLLIITRKGLERGRQRGRERDRKTAVCEELLWPGSRSKVMARKEENVA